MPVLVIDTVLEVGLERGPALLKLSDLYFARGDTAREREYREMVFGSFASAP